MPPEYEYLNAPLHKAQEYVFAIDAEIEELKNNPLNEAEIVKLVEERNTVIKNLKNEFETQTWEDGPDRTAEIHGIVDDVCRKRLIPQKYMDDLAAADRKYNQLRYWVDKFEKNLSVMYEQYGLQDNPSALESFEADNPSGNFDDFDLPY